VARQQRKGNTQIKGRSYTQLMHDLALHDL
jgi:hypothetical protein